MFRGINFGGQRPGRSRWDINNPRGEEEGEAGAGCTALAFIRFALIGFRPSGNMGGAGLLG